MNYHIMLELNQIEELMDLIVNESMETSIEGIFACGNVVHVHDLVDFVTEESKHAGKSCSKIY